MGDKPYYTIDGAYPTVESAYTPYSVEATVVDDFERGNLDPYSGRNAAPDTSDQFSVTTQHPLDGSYSLESPYTNYHRTIRSMPGEGLDYYPVRGDVIEFDMYLTSHNGLVQFGFFCDGGLIGSDYNELEFNVGDDTMRLNNDVSEDDYTLDESVVYHPINTWNHVTIDTRSGIDVYYAGVHLSTNDNPRDDGGVLFLASNIRVYFDNLVARQY